MINRSNKISKYLYYSPEQLDDGKLQLFNKKNGKHFKVNKDVILFLKLYFKNISNVKFMNENNTIIEYLKKYEIINNNVVRHSFFNLDILDISPTNMNISKKSIENINKLFNVLILFTSIVAIVVTIMNLKNLKSHFVFPSGFKTILFYLIYVYIINVIGTILHEGSHLISALNEDAYVPRIGLKFFYFSFAGFVDVTGIRFLNRKKLIKVTFAGTKANILLLSIGIISLCVSQFNDLLFSSMIIISIMTIVSNMNFFIKLDGYYIIESILNETYLREKSMNIIYNIHKTKLDSPKKLSLALLGIMSIVTSISTVMLFISIIIRML